MALTPPSLLIGFWKRLRSFDYNLIILILRIRHFVLLNFLTVWHHIHQILKKHNVCKKFILCSSIKSKLSEGFHKVCINFHRVWFKTFFVKWNYFIEQLVCEQFLASEFAVEKFWNTCFLPKFWSVEQEGELSEELAQILSSNFHKYFYRKVWTSDQSDKIGSFLWICHI